jgi:hypothetical protein
MRADASCWGGGSKLSDRRKIAAALFGRDILFRRIESAYLANLLRCLESGLIYCDCNNILADFSHKNGIRKTSKKSTLIDEFG